MQRKQFFYSQYLIAAVVVILSSGLGALSMGTLTGGWATADAANITPKTNTAKKSRSSKTIKYQKLETGAFSEIYISAAFEVELVQAPYPGYIEIMTSDDTAPNVNLSNNNGKLHIKCKDYEKPMPGKIRITSGAIKVIHVASAAKITVNGKYNISDTLLVNANTAGEISFGEISGNNLQINASTASKIFALVVDVDKVSINASTAADVKLRGMSVGSVTANANTAAGIVLAGRCNSSTVNSNTGGDIKTRGLILEKLPIKRMGSVTQATIHQP